MKKLIFITGIVVYSLFAVAMAAESEKTSKPAVRVLSETVSFETVSESERPYSYLMKVSNGNIVVLDNSSGKIITKTDTQISVLPKGDQDMLKKGIKVKSKNELRRLLEDFCS